MQKLQSDTVDSEILHQTNFDPLNNLHVIVIEFSDNPPRDFFPIFCVSRRVFGRTQCGKRQKFDKFLSFKVALGF